MRKATTRKQTKMTGTQLRRLRATHQLSQAAFADRLGIHKNTLARYERDELPIPAPIANLARLLGGSQ